MKVSILSSRPVGQICYEWAKLNVKDCEISIHSSHHGITSDLILSVSYEHIIRNLNPQTRYYNFHPSILPQYAGVSCASWVILNGEKETGVTLHKLVEEVDAGDIIDVQKFPVSNEDTAETLHGKLQELVISMFQNWLPVLISTSPAGTPQDIRLRKVYKRKDLDAQKDLTRCVRALTFIGKERAFFTTRDGRKYEFDYERGIENHPSARVQKQEPEPS